MGGGSEIPLIKGEIPLMGGEKSLLVKDTPLMSGETSLIFSGERQLSQQNVPKPLTPAWENN